MCSLILEGFAESGLQAGERRAQANRPESSAIPSKSAGAILSGPSSQARMLSGPGLFCFRPSGEDEHDDENEQRLLKLVTLMNPAA